MRIINSFITEMTLNSSESRDRLRREVQSYMSGDGSIDERMMSTGAIIGDRIRAYTAETEHPRDSIQVNRTTTGHYVWTTSTTSTVTDTAPTAPWE